MATTSSEVGANVLPPSVNVPAEQEIENTGPVPSQEFGIPEAVKAILKTVLDYIYTYVRNRIAMFVARRLATFTYERLSNNQRAAVNEKRQFIEETYNHVKGKLEEAFAGADGATKAYLPPMLPLMLNSITHGFDVVNAEIDKQLDNASGMAVRAAGGMLNFLFTSDFTMKQIGWRAGAPMSERVLATYEEYWRQATGITSNLISGLAYSDAIDTIHVDKTIKEKAELLYKMTHPEEFGARPDQVPRRHRKPYLLLSSEEITDILKITLLAKTGNRNFEGSEEVFSRNLSTTARNSGLTEERIVYLRRLFFGIREKGDIHFFYKFDPGFLHHGVILSGGLCVEVQNRIFKATADNPKRVRALVTPSSILDLFQRGKRVGLYAFTYDDGFSADVIRARALWTMGKWDYSLFYNNCEHHTTWVFGNKLASEQCTLMETAVRSLGEVDPRVREVDTEAPPAWLQSLREAPAPVRAPGGNTSPFALSPAANTNTNASSPGLPSRPPSPVLVASPPPASPLPPIAEATSVRPVVRQAAIPSYMRSTAASRLMALPSGANTKSLFSAYQGRGGKRKTQKRRA